MKLNRSALSIFLFIFAMHSAFSAASYIDFSGSGFGLRRETRVKKWDAFKKVRMERRSTMRVSRIGRKNSIPKAKFEEKRTIKKEFNIKKTESLKVINEFGKIHFEIWDQEKVSFELEVIVIQANESKAKSIADKIQPKFSQTAGQGVVCEVDLPQRKNQGENQKMEVNMLIKIPSTVDLTVKNSFGDVFLPDFEGDLDIKIQYGHLKAGNLMGKENNLDISFGECIAGDFTKADLKISYSEYELGSGGSLDLNSQFSEGELGNIESLNARVHYGELEVKTCMDLQGDFQFSSIEIARIKNTALFKAHYGDGVEINNISASFTKIDVTAQFAEVELNFDPGSSFRMEAEIDFGDLDYNREDFRKINVDKKEYIPSATYKGIYGKAESPKSELIIRAEYADVEIN